MSEIPHEVPPPLCVSLEQYLTMERPKVQWLVERFIPQPSLIILQAPPKAGKSFLALQIAMDLARGEDVLGFRTTKPCKVLYLQLDTSEMIWRDRLDKLVKNGISLPELVVMPNPVIFQLPCIITERKTRQVLNRLLTEATPDIVFLDVYREIHQNNENDSTEIKIVNDCIQEVFGAYAVVLIHHSKKAYVNAETGDTGYSFDPVNEGRGSSGIAGKADALWSLRKDHLRIVPRFDEPMTIYLDRAKNGLWIPRAHQATPEAPKEDLARQLMQQHPQESPYKVYLSNQDVLKANGISQATFYRILQDEACSAGGVAEAPG